MPDPSQLEEEYTRYLAALQVTLPVLYIRIRNFCPGSDPDLKIYFQTKISEVSSQFRKRFLNKIGTALIDIKIVYL
jgi:hypothetical protein